MHTVRADKQKRVRIPDARPGQVFSYENAGGGQFVLTIVKKNSKPSGKVKLVKRDGYTVGVTDRTITSEQVKELLAELP